MKSVMFVNKIFLFAVVTLVGLAANTYAQNTKSDKKENTAEQIQKLIQSKRFVFVAEYASPLGGRTINLTSNDYDIKVSADTIVSELPYYGRAFVAPINPSEGGIFFTSASFSYDVQQRKKGGWDITILPKDATDIRQMFLSITEAGYATLQVTSNNRQSIGYSGYISAQKK